MLGSIFGSRRPESGVFQMIPGLPQRGKLLSRVTEEPSIDILIVFAERWRRLIEAGFCSGELDRQAHAVHVADVTVGGMFEWYGLASLQNAWVANRGGWFANFRARHVNGFELG